MIMDTRNWRSQILEWKRVQSLMLLFPAALFFSVPYFSYAQMTEDIQQVRRCLQREEFGQAEQVCQSIIDSGSSEIKDVRQAKQELIGLYIASGQWDKARAAYDTLPPDIPVGELADTVGEMAYFYLKKRDRQTSLSMYRYIVDQWSVPKYAVWPEAIELMTQIRTGDDPNSHEILARLEAKYSSEPGQLARAVNKIGNNYYDLKQYSQAIELFRYVIDHHPEADYVIWSQKNLVDCYLELGDEHSVRREMDCLLANVSRDEQATKKAYRQLIHKFREAGNYELVRDYQQSLLDRPPFETKTIWTHRDIAISHIELGDNQAAQVSVQTLITEYSDPERQARALREIGDCYRRNAQYAQAQKLYQYVLSQWPQTNYAFLARHGQVVCDEHLGRQGPVQDAFQQLLGEVVNNGQTVEANFRQVVRSWGKRDIEKADRFCQAMISSYPEDEYTIIVRTYRGVLQIRRGDLAGSETLFQVILRDYSGHPRLAGALAMMAEGYYDQAFAIGDQGDPAAARKYFRHALTKWEYIITDLSEVRNSICSAYKMAADCYWHLGNYTKAIEYYQAVTTGWPDYQFAGRAQYLIGQCYERLKADRFLSAEEADTQIQTAYERVVRNYSDCTSAQAARRWLSRHSN